MTDYIVRKYVILKFTSPEALMEEVQRLLDLHEGWSPLGGMHSMHVPADAYNYDSTPYYQTMLQYDDAASSKRARNAVNQNP